MPQKEILKKLQTISSVKLPIFSLFLKTDRKDEPLSKVKVTLKNLLKSRESYFETREEKMYFKKISQEITDYIEQNLPQTRCHGIIIYAGGDAEIFEVVELSLIPKTVQNILVIDHEPFLDVFNFLERKYKKFGLAITNERQTKIFLIQGNEIEQIGEYPVEITQKTDRPGVFRSGKNASWGGVAEHSDEKIMGLKKHFKKVCDELNKFSAELEINALILAGAKKTLPIFEKELSKALQKIVLAKWPNDLSKLDTVSLLKKVKDFEKNLN